MSSALLFLPEFSWLSRTYRPSPQEVDAYADVIAAAEGADARWRERLRREAELQLWIWRSETHQPPKRPARRRRK